MMRKLIHALHKSCHKADQLLMAKMPGSKVICHRRTQEPEAAVHVNNLSRITLHCLLIHDNWLYTRRKEMKGINHWGRVGLDQLVLFLHLVLL